MISRELHELTPRPVPTLDEAKAEILAGFTGATICREHDRRVHLEQKIRRLEGRMWCARTDAAFGTASRAIDRLDRLLASARYREAQEIEHRAKELIAGIKSWNSEIAEAKAYRARELAKAEAEALAAADAEIERAAMANWLARFPPGTVPDFAPWLVPPAGETKPHDRSIYLT